jgi:hypothetical protein
MFSATNGILADVQLWIRNPAANHGWMLISDGEAVAKSARHFGSSESAHAPELVISYSIPAPAPVITEVAHDGENIRFQINGSPGWFYEIETRANVDGGLWTGLTNAPAGPGLMPVLIAVPLTNSHQFFRALRY